MSFGHFRSPRRTKYLRQSRSGGFTLIELVVTLGIVVLSTGLVMLRYASFNSSVLLTSQAYEIAFDLRETQQLAVSVRGTGSEFRQEYGLHFDVRSPYQYILMQDSDGADQSVKKRPFFIRYDEGEQIGEPILIDPRFQIIDLCGVPITGGGENCDLDFITIAFARPDFDAVMYGEYGGGGDRLREAKIVIAPSASGNFIQEAIGATSRALFLPAEAYDVMTRSIVIYENGQIEVAELETN